MEDDYMSDEDYMKLEHYLEIGAIEVEGVDKDGEIIFAITEQAKDIAPELWQAHSDYVDRQLIDLYKKGFIDIEYNEDLEAEIKVSREGIDFIRSMGIFPLEIEEEGEK